MLKIMIVDDDTTLSPVVKEFLESKGFECSLFYNGFDAVNDFKVNKYDLCILDIKIPFKNGYDIARDIKQINPSTPFLFLTGNLSKEDRIKGLELGADDYITKPFSLQELYLRINVILKRNEKLFKSKSENYIFKIGIFVFNSKTRELKNNFKVIVLSTLESKLLRLFCESEDGIISREFALKEIWGDSHSFREKSMNVYVSKLRSYLKDDLNISILNIHGVGYKLIVK